MEPPFGLRLPVDEEDLRLGRLRGKEVAHLQVVLLPRANLKRRRRGKQGDKYYTLIYCGRSPLFLLGRRNNQIPVVVAFYGSCRRAQPAAGSAPARVERNRGWERGSHSESVASRPFLTTRPTASLSGPTKTNRSTYRQATKAGRTVEVSAI